MGEDSKGIIELKRKIDESNQKLSEAKDKNQNEDSIKMIRTIEEEIEKALKKIKSEQRKIEDAKKEGEDVQQNDLKMEELLQESLDEWIKRNTVISNKFSILLQLIFYILGLVLNGWFILSIKSGKIWFW